MASGVLEVTAENFASEVLESARLVAVKFYGARCGPCIEYAPLVEGVAAQYAGRVDFRAVDVEKRANLELARQYRVAALPWLVFFRDGQVVHEIRGKSAKGVLVRRLDDLLAAPVRQATRDERPAG